MRTKELIEKLSLCNPDSDVHVIVPKQFYTLEESDSVVQIQIGGKVVDVLEIVVGVPGNSSVPVKVII